MNESESPPADEGSKMREALGWLEDMLRPTGDAAGTEHLTLERDMSLKMRVMQPQRKIYVGCHLGSNSDQSISSIVNPWISQG